MNETEILINTLQSVRNMSKLYISQIPEDAVHIEPSINGTKFNSAYWIIAHLAWTEHFLLMQGILNKDMDIPWLSLFGIGTNFKKNNDLPGFNEVLKAFDDIYDKAIEGIRQLPDDELDKENHINAVFGGINNKRNVINHTIRHEPMHIGQLSWILKIHGIKLA